jgi:hypothetical protein
MKNPGDSNRRRSVKAEFDADFDATAHGGAALIEKTLRSLGVRRFVRKHLPARSDAALYPTEEVVGALMSALLVGGRGIGAVEFVRQDALLSELFGFASGAPSAPTTYRALCELSGLPERQLADCYAPSGPVLAALDMLGEPREERRLRRLVPETPEVAAPERRAALDQFTSQFAAKCAKLMPRNRLRLRNWYVLFGDATDLEVDGHCFDAARVGRDGKKALRWQTVMLGPTVISEQLLEGTVDEGRSMPRLFEQAREVVREVAGAGARCLALLDAAYFERQVIEPLAAVPGWEFLVCANQQRNVLRRLAEERSDWGESGADARRGWRRSQVCCFTHLPEGWDSPVTIAARRWQKADEIDGAWHYSFLATRLEPAALPKKLYQTHGYAETLWMLYSTKQGHENHYKTALRDLGLHHPPSCRLGVNQAFYAIAAAAANAAMVLRWRVVHRDERGITLWRLREVHFCISGRLRRGARYVRVFLAGANVAARRQVLWEHAFAEAGRL